MIDTHCHLDRCDNPSAALDNDLLAMITVATDRARLAPTLALAESHPRVYAVVGIHPNNADEGDDPSVRALIEAALAHPRVVGVGETGVDLYWDKVPLATQLASFAWQGALAKAHNMPLVLHVRDPQGDASAPASIEAQRMLAELRHGRGVLHCTNGHVGLIETALELGWHVSFAGNLTYPKATEVRAVATWVPLERLLVETDAPYLSPVPNRGKPNVPQNVRLTAAALASLRRMDLHELEAQLDANARSLFRLP